MPELLKNLYFTPTSLANLADQLADAAAAHTLPFDRAAFLAAVHAEGWEALELKDRMRRTAGAMRQVLPADYGAALAVMSTAIPHVRGFEAMAFQDFIEQYGQDAWDLSLPAIGSFTRFASGEFAIRPFLIADLPRALAWMERWAHDEDEGPRRLASEGCRPRLPWAVAVPALKRDPAPILPILEHLRNDPSETVRRSVANNLNDIAKDHPDLVLTLAEQWHGQTPAVDALLKHACRTLLKQGNPRAMRLFGFHAPENAQALDLRLEPETLPIGGAVTLCWTLAVEGEEAVRVRLEYAVDFVKARGTSRKVFQISEKEWAPGRYTLQKRHAAADMSTRTHHPGLHKVTLLLNGQPQGTVAFTLLQPSPAQS
jgi:3-methyladenine DNA glycosylase AlkC